MDRSMISHGLQFRSLSRSPEATNYRRWIKSLACLGKGAGAACGVNFQGHALELLARATVTGVTAGGVVQDGSALVLLLEELVAKKNSTRARSFSRFREQVDARSSSAVVAYRGCRCPLLDHEARAVHERQPGLRRREGWQRNAELWRLITRASTQCLSFLCQLGSMNSRRRKRWRGDGQLSMPAN